MSWKCAQHAIDITQTRVMGIVNVTPDSFSDGGCYRDGDAAVAHALALVEAGADIIDIGGESTRPGAVAVSATEEARRVLAVIETLAKRLPQVPISIDTRHADVARAALAAGACIINNVAPLGEADPIADVARETGAGLVIMHARGTPQTMSALTTYMDVVAEVETALTTMMAYAEARGVAREQLMTDPGIGFSKTSEQNVAILAAVQRFAAHAPVLIGASRKRFIGGEVCQRLGGSIGVALWAAMNGAAVVRVHDVAETVQALRMTRWIAEEKEVRQYV